MGNIDGEVAHKTAMVVESRQGEDNWSRKVIE